LKESEFHEWLQSRIRPGGDVIVGIGDDAAILDCPGPLAAAADILVEDVHFRRDEATPREIGAKAVNRNLSDMAAMGLEPRWLVVSAAVPENTPEPFLKEVVRGMEEAAARFEAVLVGGDTSQSPGPLVLDVTVLGPVQGRRPVLRSGAEEGDAILVTGELGGSSLGRHIRFTPRVKEGSFLAERYRPTAMIDLSDGLDRDLCRILDASGRGARLDGDAVPVSDAAIELAMRTGREPLDHALADGEDFELLFTLPPGRAENLLSDRSIFFRVSRIGEITGPAIRTIRRRGMDEPLKGEGFDHSI